MKLPTALVLVSLYFLSDAMKRGLLTGSGCVDSPLGRKQTQKLSLHVISAGYFGHSSTKVTQADLFVVSVDLNISFSFQLMVYLVLRKKHSPLFQIFFHSLSRLT